jgi:hypothetical protein
MVSRSGGDITLTHGETSVRIPRAMANLVFVSAN